ncbi:unnamed protein product [Camellia sinensis]
MAEVAVCSTINNLEALLVHDEPKLLRKVRREVSTIKSELESIKSILKDADWRAETGNENAKTWVKQVRELAQQIEDVFDQYTIHLSERRQRRGFINFLNKVAHSIVKLKPQHGIASKIQEIKQTIVEIKKKASGYDSSNSETDQDDPRVASLFVEEDEVVGIEYTREELVDMLVSGETNRMVISLVGMGGVGKTTLAKKVHDNQKVLAHFDCRAWITVSQSYKIEEILRTMIKQLYKSRNEPPPPGIDAMDQNSLIDNVRGYLLQKRYEIVFDDVWRTDFWRFIKHALPKTSKGSRVIITTRNEEVARFCKESSLDYVYEIQSLPENEAWRLFCMKAFQWDFGGVCPSELEKVSRKIVRKCEGLPLAIVTIGGLLFTKNRIVSEWQKFYDSLGSELERNPNLTSIKKIVLLSYHNLPYFLKPCFLYLGIIPEDYSINCGRLVRLWMAEGFIEEQKGKTLEEVAEEYLIELILRNLVQVSSTKINGRVKNCRVHDVVREIILSKSEELSFCHVLADEDSSLNNQSRRLSMHMKNRMDKVLESTHISRIRSFFLFAGGELPNKSLLGELAANFKLLKVLDLQDAPLDQLHEEVGNLLHLRYLSVKTIPKSIGKLQNLQTLNLKYSLVFELPIEINRLHKLRHLLSFSFNYDIDISLDSIRGVKIRGGIGHLEQLQKLWVVEALEEEEEWGNLVFKELENLRQLRKLGVLKVRRENGRVLCAAIEKMKHLRVLGIRAKSEDEIMDLHSISSPPEYLQRLYLGGYLLTLPDWIPKLQHLLAIRLHWTGLTANAIKSLQVLPNLLKLDIYQGYDGQRLHFEVGGFQKLKVLYLQGLKRLNSMVIEDGALPLLEEIWIGPSPQLKEVPSGFHHLKRLAALSFYDMPMEFLDRMQPDEGEDYWIIQHIPDIRFSFKSRGLYYKTYSLRDFQVTRERQRCASKLTDSGLTANTEG